MPDFDSPETRHELTTRITRILHCENIDELDIDRANKDRVPSNPNDPMYLAAECVKETFMGVGLDEDQAETAR